MEGISLDKEIHKYFKQQIPCTVHKESDESLFHYQIPYRNFELSYLNQVMEDIKSKYNLENYTINDTTLENIYSTLARSLRLQD